MGNGNAAVSGKRFVVLDALRATAGLCVPLLHLSEPFTVARGTAPAVMQVCGHGYLAVEFFLLLMGYMFGFAYDRRWREGMGTVGFFKRRIVRLHPCVLLGLAIGAAVYLTQACGGPAWFPWLKDATAGEIGLWTLAGAFMLPAFGNVILAPFNACSWTLYYEYAGNLLYGTLVRHFGKRLLFACTLLAGVMSVVLVLRIDLNAVFSTDVRLFDAIADRRHCTLAGGWSMTPVHFFTGFVRLLFPMFFGLLLYRLGWKIRLPGRWAAFAVTGAFAVLLFMPYSYGIGSGLPAWVNGVYELFAVAVALPLVLLAGVGCGMSGGGRAARAAAFLAELSYPLYMTHYPFIEIHNWWVQTHSMNMSAAACVALSAAEFVLYLAVAFAAMRFTERLFAKSKGIGK